MSWLACRRGSGWLRAENRGPLRRRRSEAASNARSVIRGVYNTPGTTLGEEANQWHLAPWRRNLFFSGGENRPGVVKMATGDIGDNSARCRSYHSLEVVSQRGMKYRRRRAKLAWRIASSAPPEVTVGRSSRRVSASSAKRRHFARRPACV